MLQLFVFAAVFAVAQAGVLPEVQSYTPPAGYGAAPAIGRAAPASAAYAAPAPVAYTVPAHYAAPVDVKAVAPVASTATVVAKPAVPVSYSVPVKTVVEAPSGYGYSVQDPLTGEFMSQHATRSGDTMQGSYPVVDADGRKRTVDFTADAINAGLHREPLEPKDPTPVESKMVDQIQTNVAVAKIAVPVVPPVSTEAAAPVNYAAPAVPKAVTPVANAAASVQNGAAPSHIYHL